MFYPLSVVFWNIHGDYIQLGVLELPQQQQENHSHQNLDQKPKLTWFMQTS